MSRNKEKAQSGLNRYYEQKLQASGVLDLSSRPRKVQSVQSLAESERWRKAVVGEFSAQLAEINNPSLSETELRDRNTTLNRLFKEKRAWEHHIFSLGGTDYIKHERPLGVRAGNTTFYGRARELPEARKEPAPAPAGKTRPSVEYYGGHHTGIDASRETVRRELEGLAGAWDDRDVEKWMVQRRKLELMRQLMGTGR